MRTVSEAALAWMRGHDWPGNVRELENLIRRCVAMGRQAEIQGADLTPNSAATDQRPVAPIQGLGDGSMASYERAAIVNALQKTARHRKQRRGCSASARRRSTASCAATGSTTSRLPIKACG